MMTVNFKYPQLIFFKRGETAGNAAMKDWLGDKGTCLAEMARLGIPVPPGFTINTEVCKNFQSEDEPFSADLKNHIQAAIGYIEQAMGSQFGSENNPLLLSVRYGTRNPVPGMMDAVLNLGLNEQTIHWLLKRNGDPFYIYDTYIRFLVTFSHSILGFPAEGFPEIFKRWQELRGKTEKCRDRKKWRDLANFINIIVQKKTNKLIPNDPMEQLLMSIRRGFLHWTKPKPGSDLTIYRKVCDIPDEWGIAITVQAMIFGNMGEDSATGIVFSRSPADGKNCLFGEYLVNSQGSEVVDGLRTPLPITRETQLTEGCKQEPMEYVWPKIFKQLEKTVHTLEYSFKDLQDVDFIIQEGKLWILKTKTGKRSVEAALIIAKNMVEEGLITKKEALQRIVPEKRDQFLKSLAVS